MIRFSNSGGDFYVALLFRQLMGPTVLHTKVDSSSNHMLRAWAQCQSPGIVTLLLINLSNETAYSLSVDALGLPGVTGSARYDYELAADSLTARSVRLNGAVLELGPKGQIPDPMDHAVAHTGQKTVVVQAQTIRFVVYEETATRPCYPTWRDVSRSGAQ